MAVDTDAKRMAVLGVPFMTSIVNVFPGTTSVILGRGAAVWNYAPETPTPPVGVAGSGQFGLGQKKSFATDAILGGGGSW